MPFVTRPYFQLSQLVVRSPQEADAFETDVITVNNTNGVTIPLGGVVYRAKGADSTAAWDVVADNSVLAVGANDSLPVNEFAVVYGDNYDCQPEVVIPADTDTKVMAFVRDVQLKERLVKDFLTDATGANLTESEFENVKLLLANQGILLNETNGSLG
jgi:hypothetical protein